MNSLRRSLATLFASSVFALIAGLACAGDEPLVVHRVTGEFQDLRDRVVFAIEQKGLTVAHASNVGRMLNRTGKDLGVKTQIYGDAEVIEFCSSTVSREVTEADPRYVALCPYAITVYTLVAEPEAVYVAYRRLVGSGGSAVLVTALARAEALLVEIVRSALE